ncbi:MAG: Serine/threonine-protein kinase PknD [Mycoplasmataceae bacterium]|nr:Serine/threonine-protein kinase PknD [Mycoplasmataceae bacterium]WNE40852.1 MAG: Serine/threonine-protein kinase PknD [Mycoplasmataceae bacterium]
MAKKKFKRKLYQKRVVFKRKTNKLSNYLKNEQRDSDFSEESSGSWTETTNSDDGNKTWTKEKKNDFNLNSEFSLERLEKFISDKLNFKNWTSGNEVIDKFIQEQQLKALKARNSSEMLEWIPYENFTNVEYIAKGGFGSIYKANLKNDYFLVSYLGDEANENFVLKELNNSKDVNADFLQEIMAYKSLDVGLNVVRCYGISQNPNTKNYLIVMEYISGGNLRELLERDWASELENQMYFLYQVAVGLKSIHSKGLIHCDLHPGNLLNRNDSCYITDLGLCRPVDEDNQKEIYGVLPYVAPEVLQGQPYTPASDVYSLGMIMYEMIYGITPFSDFCHDHYLAKEIIEGLRPDLNIVKRPQTLKDLIFRCWEANPNKRPKVEELCDALKYDWEDGGEIAEQYIELEKEKVEKFKIWLEEDKRREIGLKDWDYVFSRFEERNYINKWIGITSGKYSSEYLKVFKKWEKEIESKKKNCSVINSQNNQFTSQLLRFQKISYQINPKPKSNYQSVDTKELNSKINKLDINQKSSSLSTENKNSLEKKLNSIKNNFDSEINNLIDKFINLNLQIEEKENDDLIDEAEKIEKELKRKVDRKIISQLEDYCQELIKLEEEKSQSKIEVRIEVKK